MASNERVGHSSINSQSPPTSPPRTPSQFVRFIYLKKKKIIEIHSFILNNF